MQSSVEKQLKNAARIEPELYTCVLTAKSQKRRCQTVEVSYLRGDEEKNP